VVHVSSGHPTVLGSGVTVGHGAIVHGCTIGDNTLVGMGSIVLDGAVVGRDCIIGAGALVSKGTHIPDGSVALGLPARVIRAMSDEDVAASIRKATEASRTECVFIHRKSMKGSQATHLREMAESLGCDVMRSEDFEPLTGN
jgi:carbonic anhydrase/acetyltransferase-like protein (isoleucine patch superfamily)